jgi:hypothetical protein
LLSTLCRGSPSITHVSSGTEVMQACTLGYCLANVHVPVLVCLFVAGSLAIRTARRYRESSKRGWKVKYMPLF